MGNLFVTVIDMGTAWGLPMESVSRCQFCLLRGRFVGFFMSFNILNFSTQ